MIRERIDSTEEKKYSFTFTAKNSSERPEIGIWIWGKVSIGSLKLERGNKPTDWSPAPEDIENKVADIQTDLQNAINNAKALIAVETQNRQQTDTNVSKLVNKTNFLSDTYIEGNTIATGTMILGNSLGVQAGITGVGAANNDVRLWAGSNYKDRSKAPFYVLQDGTLHATNANISGHVEATSGRFKGHIEATSGQIGNGATHIKIDSKSGEITIGEKFFIKGEYFYIGKQNNNKIIEVGNYKGDALNYDHNKVEITSSGIEIINKSTHPIYPSEETKKSIKINNDSISINGQEGYSGKVGIGSGYYLIITNGIVTNLIRE